MENNPTNMTEMGMMQPDFEKGKAMPANDSMQMELSFK